MLTSPSVLSWASTSANFDSGLFTWSPNATSKQPPTTSLKRAPSKDLVYPGPTKRLRQDDPFLVECTGETSEMPDLVRPSSSVSNSRDLYVRVGPPKSLLSLCMAALTRNIASYPTLESLLPCDLLQKLIKHLISEGQLSDFVLQRLLSSSFQSLNVGRSRHLTDLSCLYIARKCPNLLSADLRECYFSSKAIQGFVTGCNRLQTLYLDGCPGADESALLGIARNCPDLSSLSIAGVRVSDQALLHLSISCPQIQQLSLKDCSHITDRGLFFLGPTVQSLDLTNCRITDLGVKIIAKNCPQLKTLRYARVRVLGAFGAFGSLPDVYDGPVDPGGL